MAYLHPQSLSFYLNGTAVDGVMEIEVPQLGKQLREVTVISDTSPQYESSKLAFDSDFSITCRYNSASAAQSAILNHIVNAEKNNTTVSSSVYKINFDNNYVSGSCLPSGYEFAGTATGVDAPTIKFNFKKLTVVASSL